ncbi:hypothetical protein N7474_007060 [Penicillium riverlandense]|uniref:uncharacterized protein n=1 Tax=Penicillium riverlandense TaxID=1903569 RepID=UPI002548D2A8|nr:uncharacterized protein N7474_007060 [Penicillium riverlandense]KAJ5815283.1 hypothetical protein N7474_007060 [Penicillium riverlandense]
MDEAPQVQAPAETNNVEAEVSTQPVNGTQPPRAEEDSLPDAPNPNPTTPAKRSSRKFLECVSLSPSPLNHPAAPAPMAYPLPSQSGLTSLSFLTSPIVEIVVGQGDNETVLTAHQSLLHDSPFLAEFVSNFEASGPRRIHLPNENVEAFACFLQFLYTRDYSVSSSGSPGTDASADESENHLLRHAWVYTLAEKLDLPALKNLAHSKIHRVNSTPRGELLYARYVYTTTPADDVTLRKPIARFWASQSHVLRHEVEDTFKKLCIEVPEFGFDVLTLVLDKTEKNNHGNVEAGAKGSTRKRLRSGI